MSPVRYIVPLSSVHITLSTAAFNRIPVTIYFKRRGRYKQKYIAGMKQKIFKPGILNEIFIEICFQLGKLCRFLNTTFHKVQLRYIEAP